MRAPNHRLMKLREDYNGNKSVYIKGKYYAVNLLLEKYFGITKERVEYDPVPDFISRDELLDQVKVYNTHRGFTVNGVDFFTSELGAQQHHDSWF